MVFVDEANGYIKNQSFTDTQLILFYVVAANFEACVYNLISDQKSNE